MGHLKMNKFGRMEYVLLMVCDYRQFAQAHALPTQEAKHVVKTLKQWFTSMGIPRRIRNNGSKLLIESEEVKK